MYQSLLNDIVRSYNDKVLYDQINNGMFNYTNYEEDGEYLFADKILVIGNNINGVNVFQIRLESSLVSEKINIWYDILSTKDIRTFIDTSVKCKINENFSFECNNCCSAYVCLTLINNSIILCEDCIANIKNCGIFTLNFGLNFINDEEYQTIGQIKHSYTINTDSLNIFCQQNNIFYRFIITGSNRFSDFTPKLYNYCQACFIHVSKDENCICDQCCKILNYKNTILKEFNFCKFLLFRNIEIIDNDVIIFISFLLMNITLYKHY